MAAVFVIAMASSAGVAHAGKADQLFKKGKKLLAEKKYPEACAAFEESDRLDPGIGAKLNVAKCYQEWGKLATALRWYRDAEAMAAKAKDDRKPKIHALAEDLEATVPRLTIRVPSGASAAKVTVKLDGAPFDDLGSEQRVDPGPHKIDYVVDGETKTKVVPLERGGSSEVTLDLPTQSKIAAKPPHDSSNARVHTADSSDTTTSHPGRVRKVVGLGLAGAGVIAVGVAGYITLGAKSDYDNAIKTHCNGAKDMCDADGLKLTKDARSTANTATIVTIIGAAAVAGGLVLYFTAPNGAHADEREHAMLYVAPSVSNAGGGVVVGGAF